MMNQELTKIVLVPPLHGLVESFPRSQQPPATTPDLLNVVVYDGNGRARMAQRPGTTAVWNVPASASGYTDSGTGSSTGSSGSSSSSGSSGSSALCNTCSPGVASVTGTFAGMTGAGASFNGTYTCPFTGVVAGDCRFQKSFVVGGSTIIVAFEYITGANDLSMAMSLGASSIYSGDGVLTTSDLCARVSSHSTNSLASGGHCDAAAD